VIAGRDICENTEPAERVNPLEFMAHVIRDCLAADPVEPVAPDNEVCIDPFLAAILAVNRERRGTGEITQDDVVDIVDNIQPAFGRGVHQVPGQLSLAIDHNLLAGEFGDIDPGQTLAIGQVESVVRMRPRT